MSDHEKSQRRTDAALRQSRAQRRVGHGARCACGETRAFALVTGSKPVTCAHCARVRRGQAPLDAHHVAGRANSPVTVPIDVSDHRGELTPAQLQWPKHVRENPTGSPILAFSAYLRGFLDMLLFLAKPLANIVTGLEVLDAWLVTKFGPAYWVGTPFERFAPTPDKEKHRAKT